LISYAFFILCMKGSTCLPMYFFEHAFPLWLINSGYFVCFWFFVHDSFYSIICFIRYSYVCLFQLFCNCFYFIMQICE
jgi:hypothetical protein